MDIFNKKQINPIEIDYFQQQKNNLNILDIHHSPQKTVINHHTHKFHLTK